MTGQACAQRRQWHRALIDQQLWYLGADMRATAGNGLTLFGFCKARDWFRETATPGSAYILDLGALPTASDASVSAIICWGFGIYIGQVHRHAAHRDPILVQRPSAARWSGILLERFQARPRLVRHPIDRHIGTVSRLPPTHLPAAHAEHRLVDTAIGRLAQTMARYERWAVSALGETHRRTALEGAPRHKRRRFVAVPHLAEAWDCWRAAASPHASSRQVLQ